ncbi:molybdopterin molybdotransferase MoeA [Rhodohalobacter sp.]|uniref:molybdopterin molybdotransferase MoeA n=1 Tax=Rhodohalobacter sp. TaxID=1974210 RepID=UPI002ACDF7EF|nr:molybdopterin molybdotransferase MoeA [Rhodohalobacter sp.]MDZ7756804.1 molybdopterin molybdotransferase MoeA [Rhodohalobacter sp.]
MTDVQTALNIIDRATEGIRKTEKIPVTEVNGRILAEQIKAESDFPAYDNSAMDGYAFQKSDLDSGKREFSTDFEIRPEDEDGGKLKPGMCAYITTGSRIPEGADFVIPIELIRKKDHQTIVVEKIPSKNPIRKKGEGYKKGEILLKEGKQMVPGDIGVLKSNGYSEVSVLRKTRIAIQVTGNELDEKRNTNGPVLQSWLQSFPSVTVESFPPLADDKEAMTVRFKHLIEDYDIVVTTGGVSAGAYDFVVPVFESLGAEFKVRKVRQKPGKPFSYGKIDDTAILALPGNPISAFFCAVFYLTRIIRLRDHQTVNEETAILLNDYSAKETRDEFVPAHLSFSKAERQVTTLPGIQSHLLHHLSSADCFVHFEAGCEYAKGDVVPVVRIL